MSLQSFIMYMYIPSNVTVAFFFFFEKMKKVFFFLENEKSAGA